MRAIHLSILIPKDMRTRMNEYNLDWSKLALASFTTAMDTADSCDPKTMQYLGIKKPSKPSDPSNTGQ